MANYGVPAIVRAQKVFAVMRLMEREAQKMRQTRAPGDPEEGWVERMRRKYV